MKKTLCLIISFLIITGSLCACFGNGEQKSEKINIVTTIFPVYDWTREILGEKADNVNLTLLLDSGVDLHSYQPTAKDIITISGCDMFIYVGGESDEWVDDCLEESKNKNMSVIDLMNADLSDVLTEELVEGMQEEDEADEEGEEEETEYDEHIWLSLKNAQKYTKIIADELSKIDSENADYYSENSANYIDKLSKLDKEYESAVSESAKKTLLFADRFPFRYLTNDYGLTYYAAFMGCSAESEASFETISFLANKVNELNLAVIALEGSDRKIAKTVLSTANKKDAPIYTLDSMQTITSKDVANGKTYLAIAESNLTELKKALS